MIMELRAQIAAMTQALHALERVGAGTNAPRRRGRPPGSKNKKTTLVDIPKTTSKQPTK